jgi:hypothetical protein
MTKINELMALADEYLLAQTKYGVFAEEVGKVKDELRAALEAALKPTQEPIGYVHPEALKRIQSGETVAFRKKPYVGEATLAVFLAPSKTPAEKS